jgi:NTP pyrophosphatase (non-canonical NTP hydrolase)
MNDEQFIKAVVAEAKRARRKFPGANATNAALVEEVGEVSKALMFEPWDAVCDEAVQVAVMAMRLATEGDSTFEAWRNLVIHENGNRYMRKEHRMPKQMAATDDTAKHG